MTSVLDFILWHTTFVAFDSFLCLSLMMHEYGPADLTKRETWRTFKKTASLSGVVDAVVTITIPTYLEGACSTFDGTFLVKCR